jgi:predicted Fe-Mo cluster-binding NifX family protein
MVLAISHWQGRISPVFDVTQALLLIQFDGGRINQRQSVRLNSTNPYLRAKQMSSMGIDTLVCGAISQGQENALSNEGIQVAAFTCGRVEEILEALAAGDDLNAYHFRMPGAEPAFSLGRRRGNRPRYRRGRVRIKKNRGRRTDTRGG